MAQRPILTSLFAVAVAAAAVRASNGPSVPTSSLGAPSSGGAMVRRASGETPAGQPSWSEQLKRDPEGAGRNAAREELRKKICDFVAASPEVCPTPAATEGHPARGSMYSNAPEVMIVIAPDPVQTRLGLLFDRLIDVFEDALQDSGWEYQDNWIPWPSGGETTQGSTDFDQREQEKLFITGREQLPGAMFFRPADRRSVDNGRQRGPMIVFVVGDSPTSGVDPEQFREAVRMFAMLTPRGEPLRIMGPDFTGAGPSLRSLLKDAKVAELQGRPISVASGSVSDWRCDHVLPGVSPRTLRGDDCGSGLDSFVSFGADQEWQTQRTRAYLMEHSQLQASEIALLTEDETGFGSLNRQPPAAPKADKGAKSTIPSDGILRLTFPRGISRLRSAYQKNAVWGFGGSSGASSVSLSLDFEEPQHATDSVPVFAQQQMPVSQEGSMGQVAAMLEEHRIRAVLLTATDVIDELFVAQMLARRAPNVMLIVRGTDVLFLRSGDGGGYHNVYAVGPWPLIPRNQNWSRSTEVRPMARAFASGDAEGIYTAARYLVEERTDELQDYSSPLESTGRPPLWLSLIGHGAYWPVALLDSAQSGKDVADSFPVDRSKINLPHITQHGAPMSLGESMPVSQRLVILLAVFLSLLHAGKCMNLPMLARIVPRYQINEEATRLPKLWLQLGLTALGGLLLCLVYGKVERLQPGDGVWRLMFFVAIGSLSLCGAWLLWRIFLERKLSMTHPISPTRAGRGAILFQLAVGVLIFWLTYELWGLLWSLLPGIGSRGEGLREFFFFRSQHPLSGASPVFPLLIALNGLVVVLFTHLGRLNFTPMVTPQLPEKMAGIPNCPGNANVQIVNGLLVWPIPGADARQKLRSLSRKLLMFAIVALLCATVARAIGLAPEMLESAALQWVLRASTFLVLLALCWDLVMASVLWARLKVSLLDPLESSPLRRGFSSIRGLTWKSLWLMPQSISAQYRALLRAMEQTTRRVMNTPAGRVLDGGSLRAASTRMWSQLGGGGTPAEVIESFGEVQKRMAKLAEELLESLKDMWARQLERATESDWRRPAEEESKSGRSPDEGTSPGGVQQVYEEWVALIYIHYIRLVLIQIRGRLSTAALLYILLLWSVTCYPFMNRHVMIIALSALLGVLAFAVTSTYASINRDAILSRTTESQPGKLDLDFYVKTASMVGIPLLGFMASQFPEVSSFLFSWIEPGMAAVK